MHRPTWNPHTRSRQLGSFRTLARRYLMPEHPELFTGAANDPKKWKNHVHDGRRRRPTSCS